MENEKLKCTVRGSLRGGRAMCGYVIVGGEFCSLKPGECNLQAGANPDAANGVQANALPDPLGLRNCTHHDCGRFDGPRSVECRAMADNACARP